MIDTLKYLLLAKFQIVFFKECDFVLDTVTIYVNKALKTRSFPDRLKCAHVRPKYKRWALFIKSITYQWVKLSNKSHTKTQRIKIGSTFSDRTKIVEGIPQGSILRLLLVNIFINDLLFFTAKDETFYLTWWQ